MQPVALGNTGDTYDRDRIFIVRAEAQLKHVAIFCATGQASPRHTGMLETRVYWEVMTPFGRKTPNK